MKEILEKIEAFADHAHGDQQRKYADERYIHHPLRVMKTCEHYGYGLAVLAAAILHDVLEDTDTTPEQIKEFLLSIMPATDAHQALRLVTELTDVYTKAQYPRMNRKKRKAKEANRIEEISADAQTIKYADIIGNAKGMAEHDADFAPVFLKECNNLLQKMKDGNKELRAKAMEVITQERERLRTNDLPAYDHQSPFG